MTHTNLLRKMTRENMILIYPSQNKDTTSPPLFFLLLSNMLHPIEMLLRLLTHAILSFTSLATDKFVMPT